MIEISGDERRRAFGVWLRTGRLPPIRTADGVEFKFNPWHDPETGQFTFAGTGVYYGRRRGGGFTGGGGATGYGGGGSSGSWQGPARRANQTRDRRPTIPVQSGQTQVSSVPPGGSPETFREVTRNGYTFQIDSRSRTRRVSGRLTIADSPMRSRRNQAAAGGDDRRPSDDGGHYIAVRFNGPTDAFNHFAQDLKVNRGRYRALEDEWARDRRAGLNVRVTIIPRFDGASSRPSAIDAIWTSDGVEKSAKIPN